jgi:hypothetical protein
MDGVASSGDATEDLKKRDIITCYLLGMQVAVLILSQVSLCSIALLYLRKK